jgi:hypothetical protein
MEGYHDHEGRFQESQDVDLSPPGQVTTDQDGPVVYVGDKGTLRLTLATTGVDTAMDVTVLGSQDGVNFDAVPLFTFPQVTGTGSRLATIASARYVKANYNVTGNSWDGTLTGEAV